MRPFILCVGPEKPRRIHYIYSPMSISRSEKPKKPCYIFIPQCVIDPSVSLFIFHMFAGLTLHTAFTREI